jgi:hypothetical protein
MAMDTAIETQKRWRKEKLVDEVDELMSTAFYTTGLVTSTDDPLRCYLMLIVLLEGFGQFSPGMNTIEVRRQIREYLGPEKFALVCDIAKQIAERFLEVVQPTYTAASYFSPIDENRHTASHRRQIGANEDEKQMWAYMYAFYALTFIGQKSDCYSVTQYIAICAPRKQGVRVCYQEEIEKNDPNPWWHMPKGQDGCNHVRILKETGLAETVRKHLLTDDVSTKRLKHELRLMLANRAPRKWDDINSFAASFLAEFPNVISKVSEATRADASKTRVYINDLLGGQLTDEQALFMLMTNLIYDVAFPTNYFYSFPVRIEGLCSIMTIGTDEPLIPFEHSALTRIVTSIFMHPLLLDYATEKAVATESKNKMLLMGGCAHSANNALAASGIRSLTALLASGEPPQRARFTLEDGNVNDVLGMLKALWAGGRAAQAFIALIEMATRPGTLRGKFLSKEPYSLDDCIVEAEKMTNVYIERDAGRQPKLKIERSKLWVDARLPEGYLDSIYIHTLLYELLLNVCKHGAVMRGDNGLFAVASLETLFVADDLEIHVRNKLTRKKSSEWIPSNNVTNPQSQASLKQSGNTFLQFASVISEYVSGIKVKTDIQDGTFYHAVLTLSPVLIDKGDGKIVRINPEHLLEELPLAEGDLKDAKTTHRREYPK